MKTLIFACAISLCLAPAFAVALADDAPSINVSTSESGARSSFTITGTGFVQNKVVHVRVVDDALNTLWIQQSADASGNINIQQKIPCISGLLLHFSANDERSDSSDLTGTLWSNMFTIACP